MHGTGTPLGDPIEAGAATAVLLPSPFTATATATAMPLALLSSKSWYGHAEPAAGGVALGHAFLAISQHIVPPISHLRTLNPHVVGALDSCGTRGRQWALPKQASALPSAMQGERYAVGTSAFAFQGTNAHVLMSSSAAASAPSSSYSMQDHVCDQDGAPSSMQQQLPIILQRLWISAPLSAMAMPAQHGFGGKGGVVPELLAGGGAGVIVVQAVIEDSSRLACLYDHQVRLN